MLSKKRFILSLLMATILSYASITYVACTKPGGSPACNGVECINGGYCNKGVCSCPSGYEGANCAIVTADKFLGTWKVKQKVIGSDSIKAIGKDSTYNVFFRKTATSTTVFIDNFMGDPKYNSIVALIDSTYTYKYTLDTARDVNMWFDRFQIRQYSTGAYSYNPKTIYARYIIMFLNFNRNWQTDTLELNMTPYAF